MDFITRQRQAIDCTEHNLQIIACAGSGKTRVVTERIIRILKKHAGEGITAENLVAFTFTKKAAAELQDRIARRYLDEFGSLEGLAGMYVGTIDAFCLDLLQRYLYRFLKYDVLDEVKQRLFIDRYFQQCGMASLGMKRWIDSRTFIALLSLLRQAEVDGERLRNHPSQRALAMYRALLAREHYLDYDEMVVQAVEALATEEQLQAEVSSRIKYLTVDEYQDVNPIQERLIRQLHDLGANICVVGDDDQNIYQWRGSDVRNIVGFAERYPNVVTVTLDRNFRSTKAVVEVARREVEPNRVRLGKDMHSSEKRPAERGDLLCLRFGDPIEEAEWIAQKVASMHGVPYADDGVDRGLAWSDFAILLRSVRGSGQPLIDAVRAHNIPVMVTGMSGLFDTPEAQAAVGIFRYAVGAINSDRLRDLWRVARVGVTDDDVNRGIALLDRVRAFRPGVRHSAYGLQHTYLQFLELIDLREERVPGDRGEVVYYNLGKFSQVISDYEEINFHTEPREKYREFVEFLQRQAPEYYPEGGQSVGYARPDAVQVMTIHQAKGMEFPVVFVPCLQSNRFPSVSRPSRVWNYVPKAAIRNADRYDRDPEAERRLLYVALTRSEKYLFCSFASDPTNQLYRQPSEFWVELTRREQCLTRDPGRLPQDRLPAEARPQTINIMLSFSELKYFFECPYQFKVRFLYGFNPPIVESLGYGRSIHNALAEVHRRAIRGDIVPREEVSSLVREHLQVRFAYPELREQLREAAEASVGMYLRDYGASLYHLLHAEESIELTLPGGTVVRGRIDLIRNTETGEVVVVDFKSAERAQAEDVTRLQLHVYALGYEQRFGQSADLIEVLNLDQGGSIRELVDRALIGETVGAVAEAGTSIRESRYSRLPVWGDECNRCDVAGVCRSRPAASAVQTA